MENAYEKEAWSCQTTVIGIDEAGRGPIAGPLVVAGVVLPIDFEDEQINDSKKLPEKKREMLFQIIQEKALAYEIVIVSEKEIDELNIYRATQKAMHEIACALKSSIVLTDAMPLPFCTKTVHSLIKGDARSISIAAASILAKVTRDRIMISLDLQYPGYGLKKHKGYPTREHIEALEKHGVLPIHRRSYKPVVECIQMKLNLD